MSRKYTIRQIAKALYFTFEPVKCDKCHLRKPDIRYADLLGKWICSDCMHVRAFSKEEESKEVS